MTSENHLNNSDRDVDEVGAALSDLEITLEGGKASTVLVVRWISSSRVTSVEACLFVGFQRRPGDGEKSVQSRSWVSREGFCGGMIHPGPDSTPFLSVTSSSGLPH